MVRTVHLAGGEILVYAHPRFTAIEREETEIFRWDLEGRPLSGQFDGVYYRRGISNRIMARGKRERAGRILEGREADEVLRRFRRLAEETDRELRLEGGTPGENDDALHDRIPLILSCDGGRLAEEERRFRNVYRPVPILPPDRILSFVIQVTEGCSWNRCSFCGLYPDRTFRVRGSEDLAGHIRGALRLFGRAIVLRNSIFIGDGDPFVLPDEKLLPLIDGLIALLRREEGRGNPMPSSLDLYAFARLLSIAKRGSGAFAPYRERGFRRLYIGLETGDDGLYTILRKPGSLDMVEDSVRTVKEGGLSVGLIFLVGAGGDRIREAHREGTVRLLSSLPLDQSDLVYLSPFRLVEGSDYAAWAEREGIRPLTRREMGEEAVAIVRGIRETGLTAKAAYYPLEHFVY